MNRFLSLIVARDKAGTIGIGDQCIDAGKTDRDRFHALTEGKTLICGPKTFHTLPKRIQDQCYVATRETARHLVDLIAFDETYPHPEIMVIGGAWTYYQFLPIVQRAYVTELGCNTVWSIDWDVHEHHRAQFAYTFPDDEWDRTSSVSKDDVTFNVYDRRASSYNFSLGDDPRQPPRFPDLHTINLRGGSLPSSVGLCL